MRYMREWKSTLDGGDLFWIVCPDTLTPAELQHVKEFTALWLKQLERWTEAQEAPKGGYELPTPPRYDKEYQDAMKKLDSKD
jgi:hypothetical protein